jgi:hypothetical protein
MSSIQQGIQSLHGSTELFVKYEDNSKDYKQRNTLFEWAHNYKTVICLNGGMDSDLQDIKLLLSSSDNPYAWAHFNEAPSAMNGMLTNVAIILPDFIYNTASNIRAKKWKIIENVVYEDKHDKCLSSLYTLTDLDIRLIDLLNSCGLAK